MCQYTKVPRLDKLDVVSFGQEGLAPQPHKGLHHGPIGLLKVEIFRVGEFEPQIHLIIVGICTSR